MSLVSVRDLTEDVSCEASIFANATHGALRPNRALASRLGLVHRVSYELTVDENAPEPVLTPEAKLLRAIFGEAADNVDVPQLGATLARWDTVIRHPHAQANFAEATHAEVEDVTTETSDLPEGVKERYRIVLRWQGTVTVGDVLLAGGEALGVVDGIVDDGSDEPRLYIGSAFASRAARITRRLPTAMQRVTARSIGPYDPITESPVTGRELRLDQLEWLAQAGGRAILSEMATYTTGDPRQRTPPICATQTAR